MRPVNVRKFSGFDAMCVAGVVVVALLAYVGVCRASSQHLRQLVLRTNEVSAQAADLGEVRAALQKAEQRLEELRTRLTFLQQRIPDDLDMDGFLKQLNDIATRTKVLIVRVRPGEVSDRDSYREALVAVDGTGRFKELYSFINALRGMPRLTTIEEIDISVDTDRLCRVSLTLKIYAYEEINDEFQE